MTPHQINLITKPRLLAMIKDLEERIKRQRATIQRLRIERDELRAQKLKG